MDLRSRLALALTPALLCLACSAQSTTTQSTTTQSTPEEHAQPEATLSPTVTEEPVFAPPADDVRAVATRFLTAALEYDATVSGALDFLTALEPLATPTELARLEDSARAHLPWAALRARAERTTVGINGVSQLADAPGNHRVLVWFTLTTYTRFATVRSLEQATLTLVPTQTGWRVDHAAGAGL
jgi:hypothetical protein